MYPPPGLKFWGAEHTEALRVGFADKVMVHSNLHSPQPVKRIYYFSKLCTAMKAYDCALVRMGCLSLPHGLVLERMQIGMLATPAS